MGRRRSLRREAEILLQQIDRVGAALIREGERLSTDELAAVLALLDRAERPPSRPAGAKQRLSATLAALGQLIGARLPFAENVPIEGVGVLHRQMSGRRYAWTDGDRLAHILAARVADDRGFDPETGAAVPPGVLAGAVADELIACGGLSNTTAPWRSSELSARGIDPSDHRSVSNEGRLGCRWAD